MDQIAEKEAIAKMDDVQFWTGQYPEHMLFIYLGLVSDGNEVVAMLKENALSLHQKWNEIHRRAMLSQLPRPLLEEALAELMTYQQQVLQQIANNWSGWLFPAFIQHMIEETKIVIKKLEGKDDPASKVDFWSEHNMDAALLPSHLLDPREWEAVGKARDIGSLFARIRLAMGLPYGKEKEEATIKGVALEEKVPSADFLNYIPQIAKLSEQLQAFTIDSENKILNHSVLSVIHPLLINHERREGIRCELDLAKLEGLAK